MVNFDFEFQFEDFMLYCRTKQLRQKTMSSYHTTHDKQKNCSEMKAQYLHLWGHTAFAIRTYRKEHYFFQILRNRANQRRF